MKKILLFTFLCLALLHTSGLAQHVSGTDSSRTLALLDTNNPNHQKVKIKVYPNPASDYIQLNETGTVSKIKILNMVGKTIKRFEVTLKGEKYNISDMPKGLYLVQLLDSNDKVISTKRLNKR